MGLTLFHIDKGMIEQTKLLFDYLANSEVAVWISTPAFLEICSFDDTFDASMMPSLCKFILAGEVLTKKLVRTLQQKFPGASIVNGYGPTEGTVLLSACEITDEMLENEEACPSALFCLTVTTASSEKTDSLYRRENRVNSWW